MEVAHLLGGLTAEEIRGLVGDSPTMLELGANDGEDTRRFLDAMPGIRLFCFEPDPRPATRWIRDIRDHRAILFTVAVGRERGLTKFHLSGGSFESTANPTGDWDKSSSIHRPTGHLTRDPRIDFSRTIHVPVMPLDEWTWETLGRFGPWPRFDFLWADVQGAEADLIVGGPKTLERTRYLYTEFYDVEQYEGQPDLAKIRRLLPDWKLLAIYEGYNALFENTRW